MLDKCKNVRRSITFFRFIAVKKIQIIQQLLIDGGNDLIEFKCFHKFSLFDVYRVHHRNG